MKSKRARMGRRLNAFCTKGMIQLPRSTIVTLAITRLLDALNDDPKNLFSTK